MRCKFKVCFISSHSYISNALQYNDRIAVCLPQPRASDRMLRDSCWILHNKLRIMSSLASQDDVIKWKHFLRHWPLWGEFTGDRWLLLTKASGAEHWCFLWSAPELRVEQTIETPVIREAIALIIQLLERHTPFIHYEYSARFLDKCLRSYPQDFLRTQISVYNNFAFAKRLLFTSYLTVKKKHGWLSPAAPFTNMI